MSPTELTDLLRYASSLDHWLKQTSPEEGAVMVAGWATILEPVPIQHAMDTVRRHYSQAEARTIQPGDILGAWHAQRRQEAAAELSTRERELPGLEVDPSISHYLHEVLAASRRGEGLESVPRPPAVQFLTSSQSAWSRRCVYHAICVCDHTDCRDGWLDEESVITNNMGRNYPAVRRCPHCNDALLMAEERGIAKKPSKAAYARR